MKEIIKKIKDDKLVDFLYSNLGIISIVIYGLFLIFYKWSGSFMGDEATYAQVAKESILNDSFLIFHWKGQVWLEKPPLVIWLNILAFKLFGISETSARLFPGLFGVASAAVMFFFAKELFKSKWAGFFSSFIFLTFPIILRYMRSNMMDIPVGFFILAACYSIWKIVQGDNRAWIYLGASLGMGVLTKSLVGLLPLALFVLIMLVYRKKILIKNAFAIWGVVIFFIITVPWHLYMTIEFGNVFWREYLGFHVLERFISPILPFPWEDNSPFAYVKLLFNWSGIWIWLATITMPMFFYRSYVIKNNVSLNKKPGCFRKEAFFLSIWFLVVTVPFFISVTKLPNYMILAFFPLSLITGGIIAYIFENSKASYIFLFSIVSLLNFSFPFQFRASEYGEAHFLIPKLLIRYLNFNQGDFFIPMFLFGALITFLFIKHKKYPVQFIYASAFILIGMNLLIPFSPLRNEFLKQLGGDISAISQNKPVNLLVIMKQDQYSFQCVGAFYLANGSKISNLGSRKIKLLNKKDDGNSFCFFEKSFLSDAIIDSSLIAYEQGNLTRCALSGR